MRSERAVDGGHARERPVLRECVVICSSISSRLSIDAVDDLAGVQPRRLALGLARRALGLGGEHLLDGRHLRMSA